MATTAEDGVLARSVCSIQSDDEFSAVAEKTVEGRHWRIPSGNLEIQRRNEYLTRTKKSARALRWPSIPVNDSTATLKGYHLS